MVEASGLITSQILGPTGRQEVIVMASTMGHRELCSTSRRPGLECSSSRGLDLATFSKHADAVLTSGIKLSEFSPKVSPKVYGKTASGLSTCLGSG